MDDYSWVGPAIGAVGGYLASPLGGDTTTSNQGIPSQLQPLAAGVAQRGMEIGNMPYTPYGNQRVADFSPYQFQGMDQIAGQAQAGQGVQNAAQGALTGFLNGPQQGGGNPYLDAMVAKTSHDVMGNINSGAFNSGSFGNAGIAQSGAQALADSENSLRYGDYNNQKSQQMQALGYVPSIQQAGYMPGQQLMGIGGIQQQQGQNMLNADYEQFQNQQQWPFQTYQAMMAPFGSPNMGKTTSVTGPGTSPAAGLLGGAMLGGQLQSNWGSNGWGSTPTTNNGMAGWGTAGGGDYAGGGTWGG